MADKIEIQTGWDQDRADRVLANMGAEGFYVSRDGTLYAEREGQRFEVLGEQLVWGMSDAERVVAAQAELAKV